MVSFYEYSAINKHEKTTLHCHREIDFITCICGYVGTYHASNFVINGTITIDYESWNVGQEEYWDCRWQKNEDGYTVCAVCRI